MMVIKGNAIAVCLYIILLTTGVLVELYGHKTDAGANAAVAVPDEAIRLRILANSDADEDQRLKRKVRDAVNAQINGWVAELTSFEEAKRVIRSHLPDIERTVARVLRDERSDQSYKVEFGPVHFPTKVYGNYVYPAGIYDAVLITLGEGKGANWWCVLFPPLCFLDFSNSDAVMMTASQSPADTNQPAPAGSARSMEAGAKQNSDPTEAEDKAEPNDERAAEPNEPKEEKAATVENEDRTASSADHGQSEGKADDRESSFVVMAEPEQPVEVKFFFKEWLRHLIP
ncbi:stage II sporulation protein R [Geobacillus jurassicus]|uniref:Stage II sporulation protein R n=1 Tax=Geobacillus jurassicus TaxID=235932 RepID=A0ABV6GPP9_9BACL|nr:stage II sporulation protein R [Geobacillus jurassicus]